MLDLSSNLYLWIESTPQDCEGRQYIVMQNAYTKS